MRRKVSRDDSLSDSCIGIDDGPFQITDSRTDQAPLVAVELRGPHIRTVRTSWITIDGLDATARAVKLLGHFVIKGPILLAGVTFAGFNLIDPRVVQRKFRTPTIVVIGSRPDNRAVKSALVKHFVDWRERWSVIRSLGPLRKVRTLPNENPVFYEVFGCSSREARRILVSWAVLSRLPEPLRVAGLVGRGLFGSKPVD